MERTDKTVDSPRAVYDDPQVSQIELAKPKAIVNDNVRRQRMETVKYHLDRFMKVYYDLEISLTEPKIEDILGRGNDFLRKPKKEKDEDEDEICRQISENPNQK